MSLSSTNFGAREPLRKTATFLAALAVYFLARHFYDPASAAIEAVDPAKTGYLGGMGLPIVFSWLVGGLFAAGAAWLIGKVTLGLRTDYLAIATLGIAEIIVALLKNEDWLTRGAKNVTGLPRPVPFEIDLQQTPWFIDLVQSLNSGALANLATDERAAGPEVTGYGCLRNFCQTLLRRAIFNRISNFVYALSAGAELSLGAYGASYPRQ